MPTLEADDSLGIFATSNRDCCIVSPDKDLRQIPGQLWDMKNDPFTVTKEEGANGTTSKPLQVTRLMVMLVSLVMVSRPIKLFDEKGYYWDTVVDAFESKGMTFEDALLNARLAKILQTEDYSYEFNRPIPWYPSAADYKADDGAGVSTEEDRRAIREASREDIITVFMALQEQCICPVKQRQTARYEMVSKSPPTTPVATLRCGTSLETNNSTIISVTLSNTSAEPATKTLTTRS